MDLRLLDVLACPACGGALELESPAPCGRSVHSGRLKCSACLRVFPIEDGVPRLLVDGGPDRTRRAFTFQWRLRARNAFEPGRMLYGQTIDDLVTWFFDEAFGAPSAGDWMLDAGCGSGEKALATARRYPELQVVAMDIVDTLADTAVRAASVPNLHVVQGDVMTPPFHARRFQHVVSWGVLHHTRSTREAFEHVAGLVAPDGRLLVWIYPHPSEDALMRWYYRVRDWHFAGLGPRLHPTARLWLVRLYCVLMAPALYYAYRTAFVPRFRHTPYVHLEGVTMKEMYESTCFLLYDCLTPERQFRHTRTEVLGWFEASGLSAGRTDGLGHFWGALAPVAAARATRRQEAV